jgi:hypothetical protein
VKPVYQNMKTCFFTRHRFIQNYERSGSYVIFLQCTLPPAERDAPTATTHRPGHHLQIDAPSSAVVTHWNARRISPNHGQRGDPSVTNRCVRSRQVACTGPCMNFEDPGARLPGSLSFFKRTRNARTISLPRSVS